jgi:phage gpG-like protein
MKVMGLKDLEADLRNIVQATIHPQSGISECISEALDQTVVEEARRNVWDIFDTSGDFPSRITTRKVNQYRVDVEVQAVYGAVHEYGGTFRVTDRQRAFFWWKWHTTHDPMWKALALSITYTIPSRPYLRPAIDKERENAVRLMATCLAEKMESAV